VRDGRAVINSPVDQQAAPLFGTRTVRYSRIEKPQGQKLNLNLCMAVGTLQGCTRIVISHPHQVQTARELKVVKRKDKKRHP
jgi:hypothetical protein